MSDGSKGAAGGLHADVVRRLLARAAVFFGLAKDAKGAGNGARADV